MIKQLLLTITCFYSIRTCAQRLEFQQLGVEDGLPSTEVYNLYQDAKGYVWAFTEFGIVKHNGMHFIPVCKNLPFEESTIYAVCGSPAKELYIGNSKGHIYEVKNDSAFIVRGLEKTSYNIILNNENLYIMHVDDSSNVYFSTFEHSYKLERKSGRLISLTDIYKKEDSLGIVYKKTDDSYFYIKANKKNGHDQLLRVNDTHDHTLLRILYHSEVQERFHMLERNGTYYFLFRSGIRSVSKQGETRYASFDKPAINFRIAPNGHVWAGTQNGLYEYDAELHLLNHYFAGQDISDILFDSRNGMWVSSIENGIFYCKNIYTSYYGNIPGLSANISLIRQIGNRLFIGTGTGSLFVTQGDSLQKVDLRGNGSFINDIVLYNNEYLIGTKNSILAVDSNLKPSDTGSHFLRPDDYSSLNAYAFMTSRDTLIIVTAASIVKKYRSDTLYFFLKGQSLYKTRSIVKSGEDLYIGTNKGMFRISGQAGIPAYLSIFRSLSIVRLRSDAKGNIWICTKGAGLFMLKPDHQLIRINAPTNIPLDISFPDDSTYLLSTNKGLYIATAYNLSRKKAWRQLYDREVFHTEMFGNVLYVATSQGLITIDSLSMHTRTPVPLYPESFRVNNQPYAGSLNRLSYTQNDLYFNFDILKYGEKQLSFYYQLEGPYSDMGKIAGTVLHLQHLEPGAYRLYVYLLDADNKKESISFIPFYIQPAFWQTKFFMLEIAFTLVAICIFFTGFFYDRLKKKQEQKTMITRLLIEQRLTALKAQINPHFISNSLTGIQQLIIENEIDKANQYIAKFSLLIRYILNYSDKPAALLINELEIIDLNIELEKLRFSNKFIFEKQVGNDVDLRNLYIPPLITQPLIENAIWHGLLPLPLKDQRIPSLILKIEKKESLLVISVIDNGIGRSPAALQQNRDRESKGVWLVMNRISNLNRLHPLHKSELTYTDLLDEHQQPAGTRADLIFPLTVLDNLVYDDKNEEPYH